MKDTASAREYFRNDIFAVEAAGIEIAEARDGYAKCVMRPGKRHMNAAGFVMGGAIFTLADYTFAVAANTEEINAVSLTSSINFLSPAKGDMLTAETEKLKMGQSICAFTVKVTDTSGELVAVMSGTGFRTPRK